MSDPYDCSVCHNEGYDHAPDCPFHSDSLAAAAAEEARDIPPEGCATCEGVTPTGLRRKDMAGFHCPTCGSGVTPPTLTEDSFCRACSDLLSGPPHPGCIHPEWHTPTVATEGEEASDV